MSNRIGNSVGSSGIANVLIPHCERISNVAKTLKFRDEGIFCPVADKILRLFIFLLFVFISVAYPSSVCAQLRINEFMQSNIDEVRDDLHDFPDSWIEIYNTSDAGINIRNYYVSLKKDYTKGWKFDVDAIIPAKGYLLIYCDEAAKGLHTSFRLESGNDGAIYLFNAWGGELHKVTGIPKQPAPNISRGLTTDGKWSYFSTATPGLPNTATPASELLPNPVFSVTGKTGKDTIDVELSLPNGTPEKITISDIYYTLDGSEPTIKSDSYNDTTTITLTETTVVRAKIIADGFLSRRSLAQTYVIEDRDLTLPVISLSLDSAFLWDDEFGIYTHGNGKYGIPSECSGYYADRANWNNDWRRPMNFEYFPFQGEDAVLNQLGEMRIAGNCTRNLAQKSLILYSNKRFGDNKRYEYQFFNEKPNQEIKSFMIRNSGGDFGHAQFRDAAIQLFMGQKVNLDYQAYQPASLYINGRYWGIQNLRERSDEDFVLANYATEDIDMIENWTGELKAGDMTAWNKLMAELRKHPMMRDYEWIKKQIDIDEYINYMILQIYAANTDFPHNNVVMWRPIEETGKWRFIMKDMDMGLGLGSDVYNNTPDFDAFKYNTSGNDDNRKLFNALLTQNSFKKELYSRFAIYMGDILHYDATSQVIDSIADMLKDEMPYHFERWKPEVTSRPMNMNSWWKEIDNMKTWCEQRNPIVYSQMASFFKLGDTVKTNINIKVRTETVPALKINGIKLSKPVFDGYYYCGETLKIELNNDVPYFGWQVTAIIDGDTSKTAYPKGELSYTVPDKCTSLIISAFDPADAIATVQADITVANIEGGLSIRGLRGVAHISVYDINGRLIRNVRTEQPSAIIPLYSRGVYIVNVTGAGYQITQKVVKTE